MKYRRIIAGILTVNIIASSIWTGGETVFAGNTTAVTKSAVTTESESRSSADATEDKKTENTADTDKKENSSSEEVSDKSETDQTTSSDTLPETKNDRTENEKADTSDSREAGENADNTENEKKDKTQSSVPETSQPEETKEASVAEETEDENEQLQVMSADITLDKLKFYKDGTATVNDPAELILLSNCAPESIQTITINLNTTGEFDLTKSILQGADITKYVTADNATGTDQGTATKVTADQEYTYQGLGNETHPFQGKITGQTPNIKANTTIFGGLSSKAGVIKNLSIQWSGNGTWPMLASTYVLEGAAGDQSETVHTVPVKFTSGQGTLIGTVKAASGHEGESLQIQDEVSYATGTVTAGDSQSSADAGLICNTLESGSIVLKGYTFPSQTTVVAGSGAAGGFVGKITSGTLKIAGLTNAEISNLSVKSSSGSAGSIVGELEEGAKIESDIAVTVTSPTISGKNAGGFVGTATNITVAGNGSITVNTPSVSAGTNAAANVGGFAGSYTAKATGSNTEDTMPDKIVITGQKVTVNGGQKIGGGNAGGYFGLLKLSGGLVYKISGSVQAKKEIGSEFSKGNGESYGVVAGKIESDTKSASVKIENVVVNSTNNNSIYYHGGLVGNLGENVYLQVADTEVMVSDATATNEVSGFGGIVGRLSPKSVLKVCSKIKVSLGNNKTIQGGGGLVGYAESGSILEVSGETDLSKVYYNASQYVGQLVGGQDCALIYARGDGNGDGWKYIRSDFTKGSSYVNDIGNYGEIIRLKNSETSQSGLSKDLFYVDEKTHVFKYKEGYTLSLTDTEVTVNSVDDFAALAIAWNSHGVFSADKSLSDWTGLKSKNIQINTDIDLHGTGILGISRDNLKNGSSESEYTGTLSGEDSNSHTITLAIGETFGYQNDSLATAGKDGCGKIYAVSDNHKYIGLFAGAKETIKNLNIAGNITVSSQQDDISVGSIAGKKTGKKETYLNNVLVKTDIKLNVGGSHTSNVGGVYGEGFGQGSDPDVELRKDVVAQTNIAITGETTDNGKKTFVGGIIGSASGAGFKLKCNGITVGGSISTDASKFAYVGGVIGYIAPDSSDSGPNKWIEIRNLVFDGILIEARNADTVCGGLLGSVWSRVGVYFMGKDNTSDQIDGKDAVKMKVVNATIDAPKANVGGLAYRSSGVWEIRSQGIEIDKLTINCGGSLGLLVCHGEKDTSLNDGALYLSITQDWNTAYVLNKNEINISCTGTGTVFDELVAYTAASADTITSNKVNGVVSLTTTDQKGVSEEGGCTTYQNRTTYGEQHRVNGCSRYYYDLYRYTTEALDSSTNNGNDAIDTPEELVLWSCYYYASQNIKNYFSCYDGDARKPISDIKNNVTKISGSLDLKKYSYYPIQLDTGITIDDATITFYNQQIESAETAAGNKSTKKTASGTSSTQTQHYMMHCGLFLNHTAGTASTEISLHNVTFAGSIGKTDTDSSGVLFSGSVSGTESAGKQYTAKLNFRDITLDGLKVTDYTGEEYAPLLINQIGSYTNTEITTVKTTGEYTQGTAVASSLLGNAGSEESRQVNMSFSDIILPDKHAGNGEGIFTHSTLLESYRYADDDTSVATYNFYKSGDWNGNTYNHQVTYGQEISGSSEYPDLQKWYYDKATYGEDAGKVVTGDNITDFSKWLRYVCVAYDKTNHSHEIKVNQRVYDIVTGCGTYGDPYVITDTKELEILSEYMTTRMPRRDWKITITKEQETYCSGHAQDITFQYNGTEWEQIENKGENGAENWVKAENGETRTNTFMLRYMTNAYYDLQGTTESDATAGYKISVENFQGLGTAVTPFRGVLTSSTKATISLEGANTANGLIPYSYGSVVRNLNIQYTGDGKTLEYEKQDDAVYYPKNCFGGVIGCILGGDNIIDGVNVTVADGWLKLSGAQKHLLQVGGYVGSVCGGGVVFRSMKSSSTLTDNAISGGSAAETAYSSLYVNPYVGRVLDGYAFAVTSGETLNNTDKNYQIQNISKTEGETACLTASSDGKTVTIDNQKGLLLLSAIVNSGAASSGISNAYRSTEENSLADGYTFGNGTYGKVRNATYENIGETEASARADFALAKKDDMEVPGAENAPYLITTYGSGSLFLLATDTSIGTTMGATLNFPVNGTFDMGSFGSSYQGISARYVTNAVASGDAGTKAAGIVPLIQTINGNGTTIKLDMSVREYADDDYHAASVGGLFNLFNPASTCNIRKLTFSSDDKNNGVILQYYTASGGEASTAAADWQYKSNVGVGSFAGSSSGAQAAVCSSNSNGWYMANVQFQNITLENMKIQSPASAGGMIGNTGRRAPLNRNTQSVATDIAILLQPYAEKTGEQTVYVSSTFLNCQYRDLNVKSQEAAGGFCGYIDGYVTIQTSLKITDDAITVGKTSTISAISSTSCAGGFAGYLKRGIVVNGDSDSKTAKWESVMVSAGRYSGGFIGQAVANHASVNYKIDNMKFSGNSEINIKGTGADIYVGGIIGSLENSNKEFIISNCNVDNLQINADTDASSNVQTKRAGGIVGMSSGSNKLNITSCTVTSTNIYGSLTGGMIGAAGTPTTFKDCKISANSDTGSINIIKGRKCAAGIVGAVTSGVKIAIHNSSVEQCDIQSIDDWGSGGLIGDIDWNMVPNIYLFDSQISECTIKGKRAGGLAGDIRGYLNGSNILLSSTEIIASDSNNGGLLIGLTGNQNLKPMVIAGISIQKTTAKENNKSITKLYGTVNNEQLNNVKKQSYFSFADYNGTATATDKTLLNSESKVSPYVVTSPVSDLAPQRTATGGEQYLYGDSVSWEKENDTYTTFAQTIFNDVTNTTVNEGKYTYQEMGVDTFNFTTNMSTYNQNQATTATTDFPVLLLTNNANETITKYLDILTNGGYSRANAITDSSSNSPHVDASVSTYTYADEKFSPAGATSNIKPALEVKKDEKGRISEFATTTEYDNTQSRFTLLTVTFTENDEAGKAHTHKILIPIIVRRMLEIDFTATLTSGTNFKASSYAEINDNAHLLESAGNAFTAYLTYTYNSANGEYSEYGWDSYVKAGGDVNTGLSKKISFTGSTLPEGTQLSLIDCRNGSKVYYYTVDTNTEKTFNSVSISLEQFKDSGGNPYQPDSIGELVGVKAEQDTAGTFIEVDKDGKPVETEDTDTGKTYKAPTVRVKTGEGYAYYRLRQSDENGTLYTMSVDENALKELQNKSLISQNFYLIVTTAALKEGENLNGSVQTTITGDIPHQVHYLTRKGKTEDSHSNTASTYQISQGYRQSLKENVTGSVKKLSASDSVLTVDVVDTITIPSGQAFQDQDELYQKFSGSLVKTLTEGTQKKNSSELFPDGTTGLAEFYVYTQTGTAKTYYTYSNGSWKESGSTEEKALAYTWVAGNGIMDLPLSTDGTAEHAVSLKEIRKKVTAANASTFYVEVKMKASLPVRGLDVIPEYTMSGTATEPENYTKLAYTASLSTSAKSLSYSTTRALLQDTQVKYYRDEPVGANLTYKAYQTSQLGINLLDLQHADGEGNTWIDTNATYDMSAIRNLSDVLAKSQGIRFTLQLQHKKTAERSLEDYDNILELQPYIKVEVQSADSGTAALNENETAYIWTVPKESYWDATKKQLKTSSIFNGEELSQAVQLKVDVDHVETLEHMYSNYRVVLTAEIVEDDGNVVSNTTASDNIIYTLAKIRPEFVTPKTQGE